jgi:hypothetical protein
MAVMIEPRKDDQDPLAAEVAGLGTRLTTLEGKVDALSTKVDERFEQVDKRFEQVDKTLGLFHTELASQRVELGAIQRTMIMATVGILGTFITGFGILVGLIVAM